MSRAAMSLIEPAASDVPVKRAQPVADAHGMNALPSREHVKFVRAGKSRVEAFWRRSQGIGVSEAAAFKSLCKGLRALGCGVGKAAPKRAPR